MFSLRKKTLETITNSKSGRRRSPVPSKKHGEKGEKGGGNALGTFVAGSSGGGGGNASATGTLLNTHHGINLNPHLSPAASNLTLPVTPSTQSLLSVADERSHNNLQSTTSAPTGVHESSLLPSGSGVPKATEDQLIDDDPVKYILTIYFSVIQFYY